MTESLLNDAKQKILNFDKSYPEVQKNIEEAKKQSMSENEVILLAATKTVPVEAINHAIYKGLRFIGENRVQELKEKYPKLNKDVNIHFIGHLQTNKVKDVVPMVSMIHSVSSYKLALEISKQCQKQKKVMDILLEVNIGQEESKSGFTVDGLYEELLKISALPAISVKGLMAIPPICTDSGQNEKYFCKMYQLFIDIRAKKLDNVSMVYLSMGMSGDYETAIKCGANIVRIGSTLFGNRNYNI